MKIREASIEDINQIHYLSQQLGYNYSIEKMCLKLTKILNNLEHKIFTAVINNKIVGYIHVEIYNLLYADDLLNILGIVVDPSYRNKGIGSLLLKATEDFALQINCSGIRANSGITRENAHFFYRRNGFESLNDQKRFFKKTDI